jgi:assimilatory nitrate reductase catalytic subunit
LLVDEGRLSDGADELKAALGQEAFVELHPEDADKRGLADGARATVTTDAGEAVLDVRLTDHIAPGAAFVPFNQPGLAANELLSGSFTTAVRIEPAAEAEAEAAVEPAAAGVAEGAA